MNQAELEQQLKDLAAQSEKAKTEILKKVADLEQAIQIAGNTSIGVQDALANLKASIQGLDDLNADAPPVEPPVEEPPANPPAEENV